jgi:hypothetical protein
MKRPPKILNRIVDKVLAYKPKPKSKKAKDSKDEEPKTVFTIMPALSTWGVMSMSLPFV